MCPIMTRWLCTLLVLTCVSLMSRSVAGANKPYSTLIPNLNAAMEGYSPLMSNPFQTPDPGMRNQIFEPLTQGCQNKLALNDFIDIAREYLSCDSELTVKSFRNYNDYETEKFSNYEFTPEVEPIRPDFNDFLGLKEDSEAMKIRKFFLETNGEIIQVKAQCITHVVSIAKFEKPTFTAAFLTALTRLNAAANYPKSPNTQAIFRNFVESYGTYFMRKTFLGSKIIFEKRFTSKDLDTSLKSSRKRCVVDAAFETIGAEFGFNENSMFSTSSDKCLGWNDNNNYFKKSGLPSEKIISTGQRPTTNVGDWITSVKQSPIPILFEFDKISNIFKAQWFNTIRNAYSYPYKGLNGTRIYTFFEEMTKKYYEEMTEKGFNTNVDVTPCGIESDCAAGAICEVDHHNVGYRCQIQYAAVITGGYDGSELTDVEGFFTWQPPILPVGVRGNSLSSVGNKLYNCGGMINATITQLCTVLDRMAVSPSWTRYINLPEAMSYHSETVLGSHVWYIYKNQLFDLNTDMNVFRTYNLPLTVSFGHCAVSNETHSYVIGAGTNQTEIWVNSVASSPRKWHKVAEMERRRKNHGCLWLGNQLFITGGYNYRNDVEIFDTITHEFDLVSQSEYLNYGRHSHRMMVVDGAAAVVAGRGNVTILSNIERYNSFNKTWEVYADLTKRKHSFGLAQVYD